MVEALLVHGLQSMVEPGESTVSMAWSSEMLLAGVDCLPIAGISLREPLGQSPLIKNTGQKNELF